MYYICQVLDRPHPLARVVVIVPLKLQEFPIHKNHVQQLRPK